MKPVPSQSTSGFLVTHQKSGRPGYGGSATHHTDYPPFLETNVELVQLIAKKMFTD